ncbi:olfactory receptor 10AG1-like [Cheilinus undulatus]|uniref:olfactory receptor 10AG1-like n=1 Tax=Cheilinus undulatus TaxID=241271 RepID=UPI001BD2C004|nr:olfactory receptor 10AG1-like [Cheilinus undulatus]
MNEVMNVTSVLLGGFVEVEKYRYVCFLIMLAVYILIICCNSIVVYLIVIHRNLHEPMYIFIAALLINSILFSTNIYPKLLVDFLSEKQTIVHPACIFQAVTYYVLTYSEFLLLSAMAYDRYISICKPLQYAAIMRKTTVTVTLVTAWFVPACEVTGAIALNFDLNFCGFTLKGFFCNNSIYKLMCVRTEALSIYGAVILLNLGLLPMLFIIFSYSQILMISFQSCKEVRTKAARTCLPHLIVLINFSISVTFDVIIVRLESDISRTAHLIMTLQVILYHPLFNPLMYGLKMKDIYKHLQSLFCQVESH